MTTLVHPLLIAVIGIRLAAGAEVPAGPLAIDVADDLTLHDEARRKDLHYKVSFPDADGQYPVIVFSHGFGGDRNAFAAISRHHHHKRKVFATSGCGASCPSPPKAPASRGSPSAVGPGSTSR